MLKATECNSGQPAATLGRPGEALPGHFWICQISRFTDFQKIRNGPNRCRHISEVKPLVRHNRADCADPPLGLKNKTSRGCTSNESAKSGRLRRSGFGASRDCQLWRLPTLEIANSEDCQFWKPPLWLQNIASRWCTSNESAKSGRLRRSGFVASKHSLP